MTITALKRVVSGIAATWWTHPQYCPIWSLGDYLNPQPQGFVPYTQPFGLPDALLVISEHAAAMVTPPTILL